MSRLWEDCQRRVALWQRDGDSERLRLVGLYHEGFDCQETEPDRSLALYTRARDEAQRLDEPWWVLYFEAWRLTALTSYLGDFSRAMPLAIELMVRFNDPEGRVHPFRTSVLTNALCTYTNVDPRGYRDELESGFAYLDEQQSREPSDGRFVLQFRWTTYLMSSERWNEAYDLANRSLGLLGRSVANLNQNWHGSWALYQVCRICHARKEMDELAIHADWMAERSEKVPQLRRILADAWIWRAVTHCANGDVKGASSAFHRGLKLLQDLDQRDTISADPLAAYYEAVGDPKAAVGVRDRELTKIAGKGQLHRVCQIRTERCRLLAEAGELTDADLESARLAAAQLRQPGWFLEKIDQIARGGRPDI